jgi:PAS domain S-box-containing protein
MLADVSEALHGKRAMVWPFIQPASPAECGPMAEGEATFVINHWGRFEEVAGDACTLLGYTREELLALRGSDLVLEMDRPAVAVSLDRMRLGVLEARPGRLVRKDGSLVEVEVHARRRDDGRLELRVTRTG